MPKFGTEVSHELGREEAQKRLQSFTENVRGRYESQVSEMVEVWDEEGNLQFAFKVMGLKIEGNLIVEEYSASVVGNLPFAAVAFRGAVEQEIRNQLLRALD